MKTILSIFLWVLKYLYDSYKGAIEFEKELKIADDLRNGGKRDYQAR